MRTALSRTRNCVSILPLIALAACGGGGGGAVNSTPTPTSAGTSSTTTNTSTTTTATTTTTTATTSVAPSPSTSNTKNINYDDAEYQLSNVAQKANAVVAYNNGATGSGVKIAILDSGLTDAKGQFTGRIDSASRDMVSNRGISDEGGHGTSVASIAAAGRNGSDILGVAFDATLLVARTDSVGSCTSSGGCSHSDSALANAVDYARNNGAKVINMSLGGSTPNNSLIDAVRNATAAGIIVVISAGNNGAATPDAFAQMAGQNGMNGMVIIAGSHDASYNMSSFSNKAGSFGQYYLTAMGEAVRGFNQTGTDYLFSGTSYSAPAIAGAIAVLEQAFPTLTPKQIVDLLYSTATDAGDTGVDAVYGHGIMNLAKAFQPQGSASLAGSTASVSLASNAVLSPSMGDAVGKTGASATQAVILDGLGRAFTVNLGSTVERQRDLHSLASTLVGSVRSNDLDAGPLAVSISALTNQGGAKAADVAKLGLAANDVQTARMLSGRVLARLGKTTNAVIGFDEGSARLAAMLDGRANLPFLVARDGDATPGFAQNKGGSFALRRDLNGTGLTVSAERGAVTSTRRLDVASAGYQSISLRADRSFGQVSLSLTGSMLRENETVLGAHFGAAFGGGGALTKMIDSRIAWNVGQGWSLSGTFRQGWTAAEQRGARLSGKFSTNAFSFDISHVGRSSHFGFRVAQPMRVENGNFLLNLPTAYSYATGAPTYSHQVLNLAPKGREINAEATYGWALAGGWIDGNVYLRNQPGNVADAPDEKGIAVRYSARF